MVKRNKISKATFLVRKSQEQSGGNSETRSYPSPGTMWNTRVLLLPLDLGISPWLFVPQFLHLGLVEARAVSQSLWLLSLNLHVPTSKFFISLFLFCFFCFGKVLEKNNKIPTHLPYGVLPGAQPTPQLPRARVMHMHGPGRLSSHPQCDHSLSPNVSMSASPAPLPRCPSPDLHCTVRPLNEQHSK